VVCSTRQDVIAALEVALGARAAACSLEVAEPARIDEAQSAREAATDALTKAWSDVRRLSRRRSRVKLDDVAYALTNLAETLTATPRGPHSWRLSLGEPAVPDPALLIRRVLNGQDPEREPALPLKKLKRRPLCLLPASL
jgi:hypothetical protein